MFNKRRTRKRRTYRAPWEMSLLQRVALGALLTLVGVAHIVAIAAYVS